MGVFSYIAVDQSGRRATGSVPAETRAAALDAVLGKGLSPVEVREEPGAGVASGRAEGSAPRKVPRRAVDSFTRELASLLSAGLSLSRALALLRREASHPGAKYVWGQVHDDVVSGEPLADSLAKWPQAFSRVYVAMVRAGEAGGFLPLVLQQIGEFRDREEELTGKVKAALVYPIALVVVATGVLVFLLTFFIPRFTEQLGQFGAELPVLTRVVVWLSSMLLTYGLVVAAAGVVGVYVLRKSLETEQGRRRLERAVLATPGIGAAMSRFALVRFCRMLGTLIGAGVPLVASLRVAREALGNQTLADTVSRAIEEVQRGVPLSRALGESPELFPSSVVEMVSVAEETARLNEELIRLSATYEAELDRRLRMLVSVVEPVLLVIMAALIGTVVISMLLPLFTLQDMIN